MAARKDTINQVDFSLGAVRPEAVERDDSGLVGLSSAEAVNTIALTTGALQGRPGTVHMGDTASKSGIEVDLGRGRVFDLHVIPDGVVLYNADETVAASFTGVPWSAVPGAWNFVDFDSVDFWVVSDPDSSSILIGAQQFPAHALTVDPLGVWSFGVMEFSSTLANAKLQPYFTYHQGVSIQPSARTGAITLTASDGIWLAGHNGMRVRYQEREIVLGSLVSPTVINATVTEELPPTYDLTVATSSGYQLGEAVEHNTLGGQGIITNIVGNVLTVLATAFWDGFAASGKLVGPNANQSITAQATASPAPSFLWDMQLQSAINGYAGWGAKHKGRMYLCDFPSAPHVFATSSAGEISNFEMGEKDGDGFVESLGADFGGELKYILSAEDLLFMTTRGLYYQQTRDGSPVTPRTIGPIRFSKIGCANVNPIEIDEGAVFVDSVGQQIYGAVLAGDIYRSWTARHLTKYHAHLINSPVFLGATASGSETAEQFIYVVNKDGTATVCQWDRDENKVGWRPWVTTGSYQAIYQAFGKTLCVVKREINGIDKTYRERFENGVYMDCAASLAVSAAFPAGQTGVPYFGGVTKDAVHLDGHTATVYFEGWDLGDRPINPAGAPLDEDGNLVVYPVYNGLLQIGLPYDVRFVPWPRRSVKSFRGRRSVKRIFKYGFTVQDTGSFVFDGDKFGDYRIGEDLSLPPPLRSEEAMFTTGGRQSFEHRALVKSRPGPFRLLKVRYRVTV